MANNCKGCPLKGEECDTCIETYRGMAHIAPKEAKLMDNQKTNADYCSNRHKTEKNTDLSEKD